VTYRTVTALGDTVRNRRELTPIRFADLAPAVATAGTRVLTGSRAHHRDLPVR